MAHSDILSQPDRGLALDRTQTEALLALFSECDDLREFGREVIQSVVNALMDSQAQEACGAPRGSRSPGRVNSRNGYRERSLSTSLGDLELRVPKLREGTCFPEGAVERWSRVDRAVICAASEMFALGVSTRDTNMIVSMSLVIGGNTLDPRDAGRGGLIGGIIGAAASVTTEQADDRMWRMLPGRVYVARGYLPPGEHTVSINGRQLPQPIKIDGQYALVPLRMYDNSVLIGDVAMLGQLPTVAAAPQPAPAAAAAPAAPVRTTNNNRARTVPSSTVKPTAAPPAAAAKN